ncbi:hypothetical protein PAXINDRAFT_20730 [Paxillus involutus ATCC 200175]|uniref:Uncharacterized protein n=1 Tax=Paxillus involutus ATCC 200175 TaxID=664439 RepID=A0A0C9TCY0_PAXIN|nr:hypothetical protein PAXINDRAFT_20730 [Paxillus involutus ATCC 200175]
MDSGFLWLRIGLSDSASGYHRVSRPPRRLKATPTETNPLLHPSPLRPACKAKDRLLLWAPVRPRSALDSKTTLSRSDIQRIYDVITHAWADSTKETYGSGLLAFHTFCDHKSIPESDHAPTIPSVISAFISALAGSYSSSAVSNYRDRRPVKSSIISGPPPVKETPT